MKNESQLFANYTVRCMIVGINGFKVLHFLFLFRLGKVVNKKKVQAEGFEKYFNKESGKLESNVVGLSEVVVKDGNKTANGVRCSDLFKQLCATFLCRASRDLIAILS